MATSSISTNSSNNSSYFQEGDDILEDGVFFADAQLDLEDALQDDDDHDGHQEQQINVESVVISNPTTSDHKSSKNNNNSSTNSSLTSNDNKQRTNNNNNKNTTSKTKTSMKALNPFASIPPRNKPKRPRDIQWGVFYVIITLSTLFISHLFVPNNNNNKSKQQQQQQQHDEFSNNKSDITQSTLLLLSNSKLAYGYTFLSTILVYAACVIIARHLYRTLPGGDGDDMRHSIAMYIDKYCAVISLLGLPLFLFLILGYTPHAWRFAFVPAIVLVKDVLVFRDRMSTGPWGSPNDTDGKRTFFRELMCMSLDIISRSIRSRNNLQRYIQCMLLLQCIVLLYVRSLIFRLLSVKATYTAFILLICGKWTCSIIIRQLGFISSGCIISWFLQMNEVVEKQNQHQNQQNVEQQINNDSDSASDDYNVGYNLYNYKENPYYPKTLLQHENDDDDYDEYNNGIEMTISPDQQQQADMYSSFAPMSSYLTNHAHKNNNNASDNMHWSNNYTLPSLITSSWTISFGSIVQCALLGWITQFIWSCVRKLERLSCIRSIQRRSVKVLPNNRRLLSDDDDNDDDDDNNDDEVFMQVNTLLSSTSSDYYNEIIGNTWNKIHYYIYMYILSKYSDLGLCHVAAYYKCYTRSAQDVMNVMHTSGIEPILHDDITSSMITSFCSAISNIIVILLSFLLVHHRSTTLVNYDNQHDHSHTLVLTDMSICIIMACCYVMSFILCQTTLEIVRSSIKTVYVCFAQFPGCLHNSFPLIYHRLMRISENSNIHQDRSSSRHSL